MVIRQRGGGEGPRVSLPGIKSWNCHLQALRPKSFWLSSITPLYLLWFIISFSLKPVLQGMLPSLHRWRNWVSGSTDSKPSLEDMKDISFKHHAELSPSSDSKSSAYYQGVWADTGSFWKRPQRSVKRLCCVKSLTQVFDSVKTSSLNVPSNGWTSSWQF